MITLGGQKKEFSGDKRPQAFCHGSESGNRQEGWWTWVQNRVLHSSFGTLSGGAAARERARDNRGRTDFKGRPPSNNNNVSSGDDYRGGHLTLLLGRPGSHWKNTIRLIHQSWERPGQMDGIRGEVTAVKYDDVSVFVLQHHMPLFMA